MQETVKFCYGCNERFAVPSGAEVCPVCRAGLSIWPSGSTAELEELEGRETLYLGPVPDDSDDGLVGERLGVYEILEFVGKGGMARVYKARHLSLHRHCAVKVLSSQLVSRDPRHVQLFLDEARNAAALVHPHVVTIHNVGEEGERHFIEMEYIDGRSLRRQIADDGPLDLAGATSILTQVCAALAEAHRIGIVHRDIKPANILVAEKQNAKLADFGLAKKVVAGELDWQEKGLVGTPYFMAPELFEGTPATPQSDVYAAGVTYYFALSGKLPFVAPSVSKLAALHRTGPPPDLALAGVESEAAARVLSICLEKDAKSRYPDAAALWEDLHSTLRGLRDMDQLVAAVLDDLPCEWEGGNGHFAAMVKLPEGRRQRVHVEVGREEPRTGKLVRIYSVCAPLNESYYRRALELNADLPHGSIAIQDVDGRPHYVMVDTYPQATCDPDEVRRSVVALARWSDDVEKVLTQEDRY